MEEFTISHWEQDKESCLKMLTQCDFLNKIPFLNKMNRERENKLVRFRGMVQDILNPEYYLEKYEVRDTKTGARSLKSGKYRDFADCQNDQELVMNSAENMYGEKHVVNCVSVPGLNSWTQHFKYVDDQDSVNVRNEKRKRENTELASEAMEIDSSDSINKLSDDNSAARINNISNDAISTNHKSVVDQSSSFSTNSPDDFIQKCSLNFYDIKESDLKLNDVIEVIGFLSNESSCRQMEEDGISEASTNASNTLPKIHVIHINFNVSIFSDMLHYHKEYVLQQAQELRDELWLMLTDILAGDTLAADYLICHLISSVYKRQDFLALGKLSLNLSNTPSHLLNNGYVNELYKFLSFLLEKSHLMPITISYLNNATMIPRKDNDENRLVTGILQMSSNTHLVIDETTLGPGQLIEKGVKNVKALSDLISNQKLNYDFEFYQIPFDTDIPVLIFSQGKSLFPTDCLLIMDTDRSCIDNISEAFARTWKKMTDPLLTKLRVYLNNISSLNYTLSDPVTQTIQSDFVKMRLEDRTLNADNLHSLLVLSRLLCLSRGKNTLEKNIWDYACLMEKQRTDRIRQRSSNATY